MSKYTNADKTKMYKMYETADLPRAVLLLSLTIYIPGQVLRRREFLQNLYKGRHIKALVPNIFNCRETGC